MLMWEDAVRRAGPGKRVRLDGAIVDKAGGLAELLSQHADDVMASAAPDERRQEIAEAVFRALTGVSAEGSAIRRPLAFNKLCAVTGAKPDELRPILDAFRAPGVSFITPYQPKPIDDKTPIDISHEALIRCWRRINDKENGWLQTEIRDGLGWRLLVFQAESFAGNRRNVLSGPATELGEGWLEQRNEAWAERYGDGWPRVEALIGASRAHWRSEGEKEAARRQEEVEIERLRRREAEQSALAAKKTALWEKERARRSLLVAVLACVGALIVIAAFAIWSHQIKEAMYRWQSVRALTAGQERALKPGDPLKECGDCPGMVVVPARPFTMGSPEGQGDDSERRAHEVTIAKPFAVAKFALTFDEWDACALHGDCNPHVGDAGWGRGRRPAINVSWDDAQAYVKWLSWWTGRSYRLLSEAEYEYAARAGTKTKYPWGDDVNLDGKPMANCDGCGGEWGGKQTAPVGSFPANAFGLHDMVGNVWEWTEDCWHGNYDGAPADGLPWTKGDACYLRVVRGGSWNFNPDVLRSAIRDRANSGDRNGNLGFRVARTLTP